MCLSSIRSSSLESERCGRLRPDLEGGKMMVMVWLETEDSVPFSSPNGLC